MFRLITLFLFGTYFCTQSLSQTSIVSHEFTQQDSLRGALRPERTCYDVGHYELNVKIDPEEKSIMGYNKITFTALESFKRLQIDLDERYSIYKIDYNQIELNYKRVGNAIFIQFPKIEKGVIGTFRVYWSGNPPIAQRAPWDGGFVWQKDTKGNHWAGVACEGMGASSWWPCKDHLSDEPDSMDINLSAPNGYMAISNGKLVSETPFGQDFTRFSWKVTYPINNYNVTFYLGKYVHFQDTYVSKDGNKLALNYYVLPQNLEKAKKQFKQVNGMLKCYEQYLGPYPFWRDGFALVEAPYLGMEHQSAIAYGNQYNNGYLGGRLPQGIEFDYIIIHESGHEYFGNAVSCGDHAEMWIHESFTTYLESVFVECKYSYDKMLEYIQSQRNQIYNSEPIVGPMDVNYVNGNDNYFKGAWILHTLRNVIGNDEQWWAIFKGFYNQQKMKTTTTQDFIAFVNRATNKDFTPFFTQYLYNAAIPKLEYTTEKLDTGKLKINFRWKTDVSNFDMPIKVGKKDAYQFIYPVTNEWKSEILNCTESEFLVAEELFLVSSEYYLDR